MASNENPTNSELGKYLCGELSESFFIEKYKIKDKEIRRLASDAKVVKDPEIGLDVQLDSEIMHQNVSGIELVLTLQQGDPAHVRTFQSKMRLTRMADKETYEAMINRNLSLIFPFVDPYYKPGQSFTYQLDKIYFDLDNTFIDEIPLLQESEMISEEGILDYYVTEKGTLSTKDHEGPIPIRPPKGLQVSEIVAAKDGFGARISWGKDINPWTIHVKVIFEHGKGQVDLWINHRNRYKPKFLPITFMVPFPKGANSGDGIPHNSFTVELFKRNGDPITKEKYGDIRDIIKQLDSIQDEAKKIIKGTVDFAEDIWEGGKDIGGKVIGQGKELGGKVKDKGGDLLGGLSKHF